MPDSTEKRIREYIDDKMAQHSSQVQTLVQEEAGKLGGKIDGLKDVMNGRIKKLEIAEARRQGRESVAKTPQINWSRIVIATLGVASAAISLALFIATKVLK